MLKVVEKYTGEAILLNPRYVAAIREENKGGITLIHLGKDAPPGLPTTILTEKSPASLALEMQLLTRRISWVKPT
jgi:hypothetical protein